MELVGAPVQDTDHRIFISYAHADNWVKKAHVEPLRQIAGVDVFYDEDIRPGEQFLSRITSRIQSADEFLVVLTPSSAHRSWILVEIGMASASRVPIIPILFNYTREESERSPVGKFLTHLHHIKGPEDFDRYLSELRERCSVKRSRAE